MMALEVSTHSHSTLWYWSEAECHGRGPVGNEAAFLTMSRKRRKKKGPRTEYTLHGALIDMLPLTRPRLLKVPLSYEFADGLDPP